MTPTRRNQGRRHTVEAAQKMDAIIRAHFQNDPVPLEIWTSARHVRLMPQREGEEEQLPTDGSGESSTTVTLLTGRLRRQRSSLKAVH